MSPGEVQKIGFEIAFLGTHGIDVNHPEVKYTLKNLPGQFTGLQLLCLQYVAFQQIAPGQDIGFDLSMEYQTAQSMFRKPAHK